MDLRLPPGYSLEWDSDLLVLRGWDGFFVAAFSAGGVSEETIEQVAWEDYRVRGMPRTESMEPGGAKPPSRTP